ncbi:MAG: hypothetical protein A2156_03230 [Deltaproteobacteria bacterium RBG_16_48_10]|nr:MAG: hypothetical protein A2156_03230 [Deltaproteobacteria bacterium RBG_16_48_10]
MKEDKKIKLSIDLVLDLYFNLLMEIWETVSALTGEAILALLLDLTIQTLKDKYPFLILLKVTEEGISWDKMREDCRTLSPIEVHRGFQSLINHLFHLFSALAEGVISRELFPKVFPKVKEAERILFPK